MNGGQKPPGFADVKAILDHLVKGKEANLHVYHGDLFRWGDKGELLAASVETDDDLLPLIDPSLIGNGRAGETYLLRALTEGLDLDGDGIYEIDQMPYLGNIDGDYATAEQLAVIAAWIDAGCPD